MSEEMIQLYTVNGGKPSARIPVKRYKTVRQAVLKALKNAPDGLGLWELCPALAPHLPQWWFDEGWDTPWHATNVKLHMEYLGEIERVPKETPQRVRVAKKIGTVGAELAPPGKRAPTQGGASSAPTKTPKSPKEMHEAMERNLPTKTGRSMAEWAKLVRAAGITDWKQAQEWLKREHGLTTNYAYMVAGAACDKSGGPDYTDEEGLLNAMYAGPRAQLRPIHDKLWELAQRLGPEVQLIVCSTYISFRGVTQFAVVKPTTQTAVDLGLALPPDTPFTERLVDAKNLGGGGRNRHRIRLASVKDIDSYVKRWLKAAYEWDLQRNAKKGKA